VGEFPIVPVDTFGVIEGSEEIDALELLLGAVDVLPVFDPVCVGCYASSAVTGGETWRTEIHTFPPTACSTRVAI